MKIVVVGKNGTIKEFILEQGENVIGRKDPEEGSDPSIDLDTFDLDSKVSRRHASLTVSGTEVVLQDIGSLNGTFLVKEKKKISPEEKISLQIGDQFLVGSVLLRIEK